MPGSGAELLPLPPERYQVARKTRTVATRSARISRMRLEVRKEEGGWESSSSVPTPKTPSSPVTAGECCTGTGVTMFCVWDAFADCWKVCCRAG